MKNLTILLAFVCVPTLAASFDCAKASTKIEKAICENFELSDMDYNLGSFFQELTTNQKTKSFQSEIRKTQIEWLSKRNSLCEASIDKINCIKNIYTERLNDLTEKYIDYSNLAYYEFACRMDGNQSDLNACARTKYDLAVEFYNRTMNRVLKQNSSNQYGASNEVIEKSSKNWLQYVEQHCSIAESWGGSIAPLHKYSCLAQKYKERTLEIYLYPCHPSVGCSFLNP